SVVYTITVTNNGPTNVVGATVTDVLPAGLMFVSASNNPLPSGASSSLDVVSVDPINGGGNLGWTVSIPNGASIVYSVTTNVLPGRTGNVVNTATVSHPSISDPNPANNSSTDTNTPAPEADLAVVKALTSAIVPGQPVTYTVTVTNIGPSNVVGARVEDYL